ncbi:unnamed protein product, partial [Dovyalis caffra]
MSERTSDSTPTLVHPYTSYKTKDSLCLSQFVHIYIRDRGKIGYSTSEKNEPNLDDPTYPSLG